MAASRMSLVLQLGVCCYVVMCICCRIATALPPFEIRSSSDSNSEHAEDWAQHLKNVRICGSSTLERPTFICQSTRTDRQPECIYGDQMCDGRTDCPQGEDESSLVCSIRRLKN